MAGMIKWFDDQPTWVKGVGIGVGLLVVAGTGGAVVYAVAGSEAMLVSLSVGGVMSARIATGAAAVAAAKAS